MAGVALAMVLGHNLLDGVAPERFGALAPLWRVMHVSGPLGIVPILGLYPLVPWIGVMALGFLAGPVVFSPNRRTRAGCCGPGRCWSRDSWCCGGSTSTAIPTRACSTARRTSS